MHSSIQTNLPVSKKVHTNYNTTHTSHTAIFPYVTLIALFIHKSTGNYMTYTPQTHLFLTGFYRSHQSVVLGGILNGKS